jgi:hypothetical protein
LSGVSTTTQEVNGRLFKSAMTAEYALRRIASVREAAEALLLRTLRAEIKHLERVAADQEEVDIELSDLRSEVRELTRANRDHVRRNEALLAENKKLSAHSRLRNSADVSGRPMLPPTQ